MCVHVGRKIKLIKGQSVVVTGANIDHPEEMVLEQNKNNVAVWKVNFRRETRGMKVLRWKPEP